MSSELIPKSELPEWGEEDERHRKEFEIRRRTGKLHLVSAEPPREFVNSFVKSA